MADVSLELIQAMFQRLQEGQERIAFEMRDFGQRIQGVENQLNGVRRDILSVSEEATHVKHRMDRFEQRMERVERRVDLREA